MLIFSPKARSVHRSLACFNIVWGEGGRKKGSERRTNVAHITMEACTVNSLLFAQILTSVPKCFARIVGLTFLGLKKFNDFYIFYSFLGLSLLGLSFLGLRS